MNIYFVVKELANKYFKFLFYLDKHSDALPSFRNFLTLKPHLEPHPNRKFVVPSFKILIDTYNELRPTCSGMEDL